MNNKKRNPSFWRNIRVIDDDNNEIYRYEIDLNGKLKLHFKSKWTSKSKKRLPMIRLQQSCKTNQEIIQNNPQSIISSNIENISSQIIKTDKQLNGDPKICIDQKQNAGKDFDLDLLQFENMDENIKDEYWYYYFHEDENGNGNDYFL